MTTYKPTTGCPSNARRDDAPNAARALANACGVEDELDLAVSAYYDDEIAMSRDVPTPADVESEHQALCHADGSECPDGCGGM